jgi:hypothetical protein
MSETTLNTKIYSSLEKKPSTCEKKTDERIGTSPESYQNVISQYYIGAQMTFQHSTPSTRAGFKSQRDFWDE